MRHTMPYEMNRHNQEEIEREKDASWEAGRKHIREIEEGGGFGSLDGMHAEVFPEKIHCIACSDGRVVEQSRDCIYLPGSGILENEAEFTETARKAGVTDVTTHEGCSALARYAKERGMSPEEAAIFARARAHRIAKALGGVHRGELMVAPEYHPELVLYYDLTGRFNPAFGTYPPGFVLSRKYLEKGAVEDQTKVLLRIAFGEHGYGARFSKKDKFYVVVIGENRREVERGKHEVKKFVHGDAIAVDGFSRT